MARKKTPEERRKEWEEADRKVAQKWKEAAEKMDALLAASQVLNEDLRRALEVSKEALSWIEHISNFEGVREGDENYEELKNKKELAESALAHKLRLFAGFGY